MTAAEVDWRAVEVVMLAVSTPSVDDQIVLDYIEAAALDVGRGLAQAEQFVAVVVRSTVPPTTTEQRITPILEHASGKRAGVDFGVAESVVVRPRLEFPGLRFVVMGFDFGIELARDAADDLLVADVGPAEAAGGEAAEVGAGVDDEDALAHARDLHGGGDSGGSRAIDDDVGLPWLREGEQGEGQKG